jgi:hypothetical protein
MAAEPRRQTDGREIEQIRDERRIRFAQVLWAILSSKEINEEAY